jgi:hypothetical protein
MVNENVLINHTFIIHFFTDKHERLISEEGVWKVL